MSITINHQTNDISATSGSLTIDGAAAGGADNTKMPLAGGTFTGDVTFLDNEMLYFGTSSDAMIYHNNVNLTFWNNTGDMHIINDANGKDVIIESDDSFNNTTPYFRADGSTGESLLYHRGSEKIKTKSSGVQVTGDIVVTGTVDGRDLATNIPYTLGTAGQVLTVNSGASAAEWDDAPSVGNANYTKVSLSHSTGAAVRYIKIATLNTSSPTYSNSTFVFSILLEGRGSAPGASEFTVHVRSGENNANSSVVVEQNHNNQHSLYDTDSFIFYWNSQSNSELWLKLPNHADTAYQACFAKLVMSANEDTTYVSGQDDVTIHTGQSWSTSAPSGTNQVSAQWLKKKFGNILLSGAITEDVYAPTLGSGTHQIDPASNGGIFYITLTTSVTLGTSNLLNGQSQVLMIDDGSGYTITWPTMTWINNGGSAPTLSTTARTTVVVWKANSIVYGALVGDGT